MMRKIFYTVIIYSFCILVFQNCSKETINSDQDRSFYLPISGEVDGWIRDQELLTYEGEDLYLYINGGAEIYHEYGFKKVSIQDYANPEGKSISLEIFEMNSSESAYGIYSFKTSTEGEEIAIGNEGRLEGYYLNFWKGNYLVTITGFDEDEETVEGLKSLARFVDAKIKPKFKVERPGLTRLLPDENMIESSIKYFKGHLGLFNSYPFSTKNIFRIKEGVKGSYESDYDIYIIKYEDSTECLEIFKEAKGNFKKDPRYNKFLATNDSCQFKDDKDTLIFLQAHQNYIIIVLGVENQDKAKQIADKASNKM